MTGFAWARSLTFHDPSHTCVADRELFITVHTLSCAMGSSNSGSDDSVHMAPHITFHDPAHAVATHREMHPEGSISLAIMRTINNTVLITVTITHQANASSHAPVAPELHYPRASLSPARPRHNPLSTHETSRTAVLGKGLYKESMLSPLWSPPIRADFL